MNLTDKTDILIKFKEIEQIITDYQEELWLDKEFSDNMMYILGRFLITQKDLTDEEVEVLHSFMKRKVEEFIKTKAN